MRTQCRLLVLFALLVPLIAAARGPAVDQVAGGWSPIKDLKDPHVQEIANWAVSEYNRINHKGLVFQVVLQGQDQLVAGINYKLLISVKDGSSTANYEGVVYENLDKIKKLTSFTKK
ncbi:cysteine proteinase inhibitor 1-like [Argentina anserina]|uniref:cysteine proteinase inhibitor 1-like n=1 Tax=Argentina anserina TaxID=57926 RepID=UPI0021767AD7|nr:cysteine proteinase inhibitor 1-like [Potentilla anserina]